MAETVLTRKEVKEFPLDELRAILTPFSAPFAEFAKYFLMRDGPGYTGNRNSQQEQLDDLFADRFQLLYRESSSRANRTLRFPPCHCQVCCFRQVLLRRQDLAIVFVAGHPVYASHGNRAASGTFFYGAIICNTVRCTPSFFDA
jgi:hypothetical protein